jgi:hypothetical protein
MNTPTFNKWTTNNRKSKLDPRSSRRWSVISLAVAIVAILTIADGNVSGQLRSGAVVNHEHSEAAKAVNHLHSREAIDLPHIHGMDFSSDGTCLSVAAHDGLRIFTSCEWLIPDVPINDYMGYAPIDEDFYSSEHPSSGSKLANPLGLIKSTDRSETLINLAFADESDFHLMDVGYYNHASYVVNAHPNLPLSAGLYYSLDDGETWQQSSGQGITTQPIAVHPTQTTIVAIATEGGLYFSMDYGNTFVPVAQSGPTTAATFSPGGNILIFGYQTFASYDLASQTIETVAAPAIVADNAISYVAVNPVQPAEMAIATFNRDLYLSQDGGQTWTSIAKAGKGLKAE